MTEVRQSQILSRNRNFQKWVFFNIKRLIPDRAKRKQALILKENPVEFTAAAIRLALDIPTRAIMNQDGAEASRARMGWRAILERYEDDKFGRIR